MYQLCAAARVLKVQQDMRRLVANLLPSPPPPPPPPLSFFQMASWQEKEGAIIVVLPPFHTTTYYMHSTVDLLYVQQMGGKNVVMMSRYILVVTPLMSYPTTNGGMQKWKLSRNMYTLHTRFCTFGTNLHAQSVLINKISASELSRKFIKSALLVGY